MSFSIISSSTNEMNELMCWEKVLPKTLLDFIHVRKSERDFSKEGELRVLLKIMFEYFSSHEFTEVETATKNLLLIIASEFAVYLEEWEFLQTLEHYFTDEVEEVKTLIVVEKLRFQGKSTQAKEILETLELNLREKTAEIEATLPYKIYLDYWKMITYLSILYAENQVDLLDEKRTELWDYLKAIEKKHGTLLNNVLNNWYLRLLIWEQTLKYLRGHIFTQKEIEALEKHPFAMKATNRIILAQHYNFLAVIATQMHYFFLAKRFYQKALLLSKKVGYDRGYNIYLMNLASMSLKTLDIDDALKYQQELAKYWKSIPNIQYYLIAKSEIISIRRTRHEFSEARRELTEISQYFDLSHIKDPMLAIQFLEHTYALQYRKESQKLEKILNELLKQLNREQHERFQLQLERLAFSKAYHHLNFAEAETLGTRLLERATKLGSLELIFSALRVLIKIKLFSYSFFPDPVHINKLSVYLNKYEKLSTENQYFIGILTAQLGKILVVTFSQKHKNFKIAMKEFEHTRQKLKNIVSLPDKAISRFLKKIKTIKKQRLTQENISELVALFITIFNSLNLIESAKELQTIQPIVIFTFSESGVQITSYWFAGWEEIIRHENDMIISKKTLLSNFLSAIRSFATELFGEDDFTFVSHGSIVIYIKQMINYSFNICMISKNASYIQAELILNAISQKIEEDVELLEKMQAIAITGIQDLEIEEKVNQIIDSVIQEYGLAKYLDPRV